MRWKKYFFVLFRDFFQFFYCFWTYIFLNRKKIKNFQGAPKFENLKSFWIFFWFKNLRVAQLCCNLTLCVERNKKKWILTVCFNFYMVFVLPIILLLYYYFTTTLLLYYHFSATFLLLSYYFTITLLYCTTTLLLLYYYWNCKVLVTNLEEIIVK